MAGFHKAASMNGQNSNLAKLMMSDLGSQRRELVSLSDYDENTRPVYHASIEKNRLVNQKGSEESVVSVEQREKLGGWNAVHKKLGNDGTVTEQLDDSSRGQAHRIRLMEDPTVKARKPDDDYSGHSQKEGANALRSGPQGIRGGGRASKHGRVRVPKNVDEGFKALTEAAGASQKKKPRMASMADSADSISWDSRLASPTDFMDRATRNFSAPVKVQTIEHPATANTAEVQAFRSAPSKRHSEISKTQVERPNTNVSNGGESPTSTSPLAAAPMTVSQVESSDSSYTEKMKALEAVRALLMPGQYESVKSAMMNDQSSNPPATRRASSSQAIALLAATHSVTDNVSDVEEAPGSLDGPGSKESDLRSLNTDVSIDETYRASIAPTTAVSLGSPFSNPTNTERSPLNSATVLIPGNDKNIIGEWVHRDHFLPLSKHTKPVVHKTPLSTARDNASSPPTQQFRALSLNDPPEHEAATNPKGRGFCRSNTAQAPHIPMSAATRQYAGLDLEPNKPLMEEKVAPTSSMQWRGSWKVAPYDSDEVAVRRGPALPSFLSGRAAPADPGAAARLQYGGTIETKSRAQSQQLEERLVVAKPPRIKPEPADSKYSSQMPPSTGLKKRETESRDVKQARSLPPFLISSGAPTDSGAAARCQYGNNMEERTEKKAASPETSTFMTSSLPEIPFKFEVPMPQSNGSSSIVLDQQGQENVPIMRKKDPFARGKKVRV